MRILAVDPGGTTGWALFNGEVHWGQVPGGISGFWDLWRETRAGEFPTTIVIERYTIAERTTKYSRQTDALELTGALKALAKWAGHEVVIQTPAEAKRIFTDDRLRQFGWWATGEEHARDALRHMGLYLAKKKIIRLTGPAHRCTRACDLKHGMGLCPEDPERESDGEL